jgi:hypothetical protein
MASPPRSLKFDPVARAFPSILIAVLVTLWTSSVAAAESDLRAWSLFALQGNLNSRWALYGEVQPRFGEGLSQLDRVLVRGAVGFRLRPKLSAWLGYAWTPTFGGELGFRDEQRPFQQLTWEEDLAPGIYLQNRSRLEQRWIEGSGGLSLRFRHLARMVVWPVRAARWGLAFSNEVFLTINDLSSGPPAGFDQNRTFVGLNYRWSYEVELEVGYLNNVVRQRAPAAAEVNHVLALFVWTSLF